MIRFSILILSILLLVTSIDDVQAGGINSLGEVVRLSKQGLNYTTASVRLGQRFSPAGVLQPATLTISGIPKGAKIEYAYFWISTSGDGAPPLTLTFTNPGALTVNYPMAPIGSGADKCWDFKASLSYRANVTASIKDPKAIKPEDAKNANYNGTYIVSGLPTKAPEPDPIPPALKKGNDVDGGTLMIIYTDPNANYIGNLIINDGSVVRAPGTATQTISGVNPILPNKIPSTGKPVNARAFIGAGDFQFSSDAVSMNGGPTFLTTDWNWWNFYDRPTTITKGQTTSSFTVSSSNDCWNWTLMGVYYQTFELELIGLEVNQTIQDLENNIPLIEKKTTIIRAFVQSNDATIKNIQPKLKVKRGTDSVYLTAENVNSFKAQAQTTGEAEFIAKRMENFKKTNKYLFFILPLEWCRGIIELSFEQGIDCKAVASISTNCKTTVSFNPSKVMDLKFYNSEWTNENGVKQTISKVNFEKMVNTIIEGIKSFYPVSTINRSYGKNSIGVYNFTRATPSDAPYLNLFNRNNSLLVYMYNENHPPELTNYYLGLVHAPVERDPYGKAVSFGGSVATFHDKSDPATVPHEIAHLLNRQHVPFCGAETDEPQGFPPNNVFNGKPSLGPMNMGVVKRIYGYNQQTNTIIDPEKYSELMSYCFPLWPSNFTYNALSAQIASKFSTTARLAANSITSGNNKSGLNKETASTYRLVRGTINLTNNDVAFDPIVLFLSSITPETPIPGNFQIQLFDVSNNLLNTIPFEPTLLFQEDSSEPKLAKFIIPVLWNDKINRVVVKGSNSVIGEIKASVNSPTAHVLYPNGLESLANTTATFTWEANDADNDSLTFCVEFSKDGGNNWEMLDIDITNKNYVADLSYLGATNKGLVRILVSDGFNVAMDESDGPFSTPNSAPEAYINSPANGDVFIGEQPIIFRATARDLEDKNVDSSHITWYSSIDGLLGKGENIYKPASELSQGDHTIYFTVTDSNGDSTKDSIRIVVQRIAAPGTVYYSKPSGDLHNTLSWGTNPDGSGTNPPDFSNNTFQLANRSGIYTMTGNWEVEGVINIPLHSQLQLNDNTLYIGNSIGTGTVSGSPKSNLISLASSDAFTLTLTPGSNSLNNLTVNSGANTVLGSIVDLYGVLTVDGELNTGATSSPLLTFKSSDSNTARLAPVNGTIVQGLVKTEKYVPARRAWRMMNSPLDGLVSIFDSWQESRTNTSPDPNPYPGYGTHITGGTVTNGFDQNPGSTASVKRFNNETNTWDPLNQTTSEPPNLATMIFIRGDRGIPLGNSDVPPTPTILRHTGQLNVGDVNSFVFATGFTAIRNPYQSPINFKTLTRDNVQNNFYVWDPKMGGADGTGAYVLLSYNGSSYDVIPASASPESQYIQTAQSFMVRTVSQSLPGSIVFKESDKSSTPTMDVFRTERNDRNLSTPNAPLFSNPQNGQGLRINLQVKNDDGSSGIVDEVFSSYAPTYSGKVDEFDGVKMINMEENLGIVREGQTLMVERKPLPNLNDTIGLKIWNTVHKSYLLEFNPINLTDAGLFAILEDKFLRTSTLISLTENTKIQFSITGDVASAAMDRFQVILTRRVPDMMTTLSAQGRMNAYPNPINGKVINVSFFDVKEGNYQIALINSLGQTILRKNIYHQGGSAVQRVQLDRKLSKGLYHLLITNKEKTIGISLLAN